MERFEGAPESEHHPEEVFTLESAFEAAKEDRLRDWVVNYLESTEGGNQGLADKIKEFEEQGEVDWAGPSLVSLEELTPIVSGKKGERKFHDTEWDRRTDEMAKRIEDGWNPSPLIATTYFGQENALADGNHRWEALRKAGREEYWTIFATPRSVEEDGG